ncbi:SAP domain-containing protein [Cephalotus follicularis]|uniref:SAP domain-containing protein n=1 Tax=Cephalotus follicularis TaxID=3775 RepID=A0A1Q3BX33_CEPFO|nr:SAP domain-containing protein [Cephalotus follicularis]
MAERLKEKPTLIYISSSDSEEEEEDDDDITEETGSDFTLSKDDDDDDDDDDGNEEHENQSNDDDEFRCCDRVIGLLKGGDLGDVNVKECKAYLRHHGLRVQGTKVVCIQRIMEHWRIKDGKGEALYPRSSFVINCRGDVCKGDIVLFTQKVYEKFDKVTRHGRPFGKRTVAGRVIKESYGAALQQHTFTVRLGVILCVGNIEVLWSTGIKKLPPLFPLLVKGRNLYKLKTFRQRWNNEAERVKVLDEKHERGTAARLARAMNKRKTARSRNGGAKHQKNFHRTRPSQMRTTIDGDKAKQGILHRKDTARGHEKLINHQVPSLPRSPRQVFMKQNAMSRTRYSPKHQKFGHFTEDRGPTHQAYCNPQNLPHQRYCNPPQNPPHQPYGHPPQNLYPSQENYYYRNRPFHFSGNDMGSSSNMVRLPPSRHPFFMHSSQHRRLNHSNYAYDGYLSPSYSYERS